jgi:ribonuclease D
MMPDSGDRLNEPITTTSNSPRLAGAWPVPFVTVDTEFLRETTYYPLLCVAQMASPQRSWSMRWRRDRFRAVLRTDGERTVMKVFRRRARTSKSSGIGPS